MSLALRLLYLTAAAGLLALAFSQHLAADLHARPTRLVLPKAPRTPLASNPAAADDAARAIARRGLFDSDAPPHTPEARLDACGRDRALLEPVGLHDYVVDRVAYEARIGVDAHRVRGPHGLNRAS